MDSTAFLCNDEEYTIFSFNGRRIRFLTGRNLLRYIRVKEWDMGYIIVDCQNRSNPDIVTEDYIDLVPILQNLLIDPEKFLSPIKEVVIKNALWSEDSKEGYYQG